MRRNFAYFLYICRHKWFVFLACLKLDVSLWQAIIHDFSKFSHSEWKPYAQTFFNEDGTRRDLRRSDGGYDPNNTGKVTDFSFAWIHHQKNLHHWQAWISIGDGGKLKPVIIPEKYVREMIADWTGAGQAITGNANPREWFEKNQFKLILHPDTRHLINNLMDKYYPKAHVI